jgi:cytochrome c
MKAPYLIAITASLVIPATCAQAAGDAARGARVFQACAACHSIQPGEHMTGPSLADVWNRKAGAVRGFERYSEALERSNVVWNDSSLDQWLASPDKFIPGSGMTFPGLREKQARQDVAAFLQAASRGKAPIVEEGRGGMMMSRGKPNLKRVPPEGQVSSIEYCRDTYLIKTAAGTADKVWEFNLRLKTDSSKDGPLPGKPVVVGAGMQGDRVSVIFAAPGEISGFITACR